MTSPCEGVIHDSYEFLQVFCRTIYLVMPPDMTPQVGKLLEFNTSCAPVFVQRAALVALQQTDAITPRIVAHLKGCRDALVPLLQAVPGVQAGSAPGGMYVFLRVAGYDDSLALAKRLVAEAVLCVEGRGAAGAGRRAAGRLAARPGLTGGRRRPGSVARHGGGHEPPAS
jgi:aspartate/methionine/tyrosine aminotransferase